MMKRSMDLTEYGEGILESYSLTEQERQYLQSLSDLNSAEHGKKRFYFDELRQGLRIRTLSWAGVIELERARIAIRPKFDRGFEALLDMIGFVEGLPAYRWHRASAGWGKNDLVELLLSLFLEQVDQLWKRGILKDYVTEEDSLPVLRGRPDLIRNLRENQGFPNRIACRYDELVTNQPENQVILLALETGSRFKARPDTVRKINRYRSEFGLMCEPYPSGKWPEFHYHRLNAHYEPVHRIAKYIVDQLNVNNIYRSSDTSFCSMMIDMNKLFEDFVGTLLNRYLPEHYRVQASHRVTDAVQVDGTSYRHVIPDLVVYDTAEQERRVLDVKYKDYGGKPVDTADLFQLSFYAQYFNKTTDPHLSVIVYPQFAGRPDNGGICIELLKGTQYEGRVVARSLPIEQILAWQTEKRISELRAAALQLVKGV
ncbi:McrC family protein [Paenibacillus tepidiphilus]|uniref:McrC family protein n=1 Tax=Paenibacillus tepidiphilus TaxID=2608683 RepID=UPI00123C7372|nr:hypothetical protein [Paenibacillus tepidiphilus]